MKTWPRPQEKNYENLQGGPFHTLIRFKNVWKGGATLVLHVKMYATFSPGPFWGQGKHVWRNKGRPPPSTYIFKGGVWHHQVAPKLELLRAAWPTKTKCPRKLPTVNAYWSLVFFWPFLLAALWRLVHLVLFTRARCRDLRLWDDCLLCSVAVAAIALSRTSRVWSILGIKFIKLTSPAALHRTSSYMMHYLSVWNCVPPICWPRLVRKHWCVISSNLLLVSALLPHFILWQFHCNIYVLL